MAKPPPKKSAILTPQQITAGIERLAKRLEELKRFDPNSAVEQYNIPEMDRLSASIDDALVRTFGVETVEYERYKYAKDFDNGPHNYAFAVPISEVRKSLTRSKSSNIVLLEQAIEGLQERLAEFPAASHSEQVSAPQEYERKVFIVHGHDNEAKVEIARFLERIGFVPIILHEQASKNQTVIEKIESNSDVGFAIVLLTPDDEGNKKGDLPQPRARQNVVLELGYFVGHLRRERVCALMRGKVEIPSDFGGIVYETFDEFGGWKSKLAKELEAAKYVIDWAKVHK
jgi:predicted nucleotide-binding protein